MERDILDRLKSLIDGNHIELTMFFKVCALMGISFPAAMAAASSSPALANSLAAGAPAPSGYEDFVSPEVIAYVHAVRTSNANETSIDDPFFVKKSGDTYHAFDNFSKSPN